MNSHKIELCDRIQFATCKFYIKFKSARSLAVLVFIFSGAKSNRLCNTL